VNILFKKKKFGKICNEDNKLIRKFGPQMAKIIRRRLDELSAANNLSDMRTLPQARCHELSQNRSGQLSVDLKQPYRLIFEPANNPTPTTPDGGLDWERVTIIRIIEIEDTHG
jgi:proteic killer suppression protein